eukprot:scaffold12553_cov20-Tisochrysis_lutea.AAC.1
MDAQADFAKSSSTGGVGHACLGTSLGTCTGISTKTQTIGASIKRCNFMKGASVCTSLAWNPGCTSTCPNTSLT